MTILDPADPVFQSPSKIGAADFNDWVEQRGSKFSLLGTRAGSP